MPDALADHEAVALARRRAARPAPARRCAWTARAWSRSPPTPSGVMAASLPPAIMASASPRWMSRKESPMAWALVVQAVQVAEFGPLGPGADGDPARGQVHDRGGDEEGADPARARRFMQRRCARARWWRSRRCRCRCRRPTISAFAGVDREPGVLHREVRGRHRELDEAVHLLDVLLLHPAQRVEALHLAGEAGGVLGGVEEGDGAGARPAGQEALPGLLGADAERGHEPDARHHDPALCHCDLAFRTRGAGGAYFLALSPCFSM